MLSRPKVSEVTNESDLDKAIKWLEKEPHYWPKEDEDPQELPANPTPEQLRDSVSGIAADAAEAITALRRIVEDQAAEITKLKGHRHDLSKMLSGRPEI
jgi:hypothetical protein